MIAIGGMFWYDRPEPDHPRPRRAQAHRRTRDHHRRHVPAWRRLQRSPISTTARETGSIASPTCSDGAAPWSRPALAAARGHPSSRATGELMAPSARGLFRATGVSASDVARFFAKVGAPDANGCMPWRGAINSGGYGHIRWGGRVVEAHRVSIFLSTGLWPADHVLHSCDNPPCCNPAHLRESTHHENMLECSAKGRNRTPRPGNGYRKLGDEALAEIRRRFASGETNKSALAREFGVTAPRIRQVLRS